MAGKHSQTESMLVKGEDLDRMLALAGEVIIASSSQQLMSRALQKTSDDKKLLNKEILDEAKDLASSTSLLSSDLHRLVQSIRTVDLKDMGFRSRRLVRDVSRKTGKVVQFKIIGEDIAIDKAIVEQLHDPVAHQIRNAVDHGIEDVRTRAKNGKPEEGHVILRAYNTDQETFIEIEDDGAGIDMEALYRKGIADGIISENEPFNEETALEIMCFPGFSISEEISKISGRGVGMDVVKNHIDKLGGVVSLETEAGRGTTFTFRVPLASAVNIVDALVVKAGENIFAFPISSVVASISLPRKEISSTLKKGTMVKYLGNLLPLHNLKILLNREDDETGWLDKDAIHILIVEHKGKKIGLAVSEFLAPQKLVIIPFNELISVTGMVGTTILGGGQLGFIMDIPAVIELAMDKKGEAVIKRAVEGKDKKGEEEFESAEPTEIEQDDRRIESEDQAAVRQEYIVELKKLLPELNEYVFALESDPTDEGRINGAFRLFHTIKGNLIMMGLPKGGETVHSVESVLDQVRGQKLQVSPEVMDIIMDGVSYIEDVVRNAEDDSWEEKAAEDVIERSLKLLPEITFDRKEVVDVASAEVGLSHESEYRIQMHRRNRTPLYQIYMEFEPDGQPSFLVACLIYKRICEVGDVLGTVPFLGDIEKGMMTGKIKLLFASGLDSTLLEESLKELFTIHYNATLMEFRSVRY